MSKTKKKKAGSTEMDELKKIYKEAWDEGIFLCEFKVPSGSFAAAGSLESVKELERQLGREIEISEITLGNCFNLGTVPGNGRTRAEACRNAIREYKDDRKIK